MKITATAAIPYTVVVSIPAGAAEAVTVETEVDVAGAAETVTLVVTMLVVAGGMFCRVNATMSPGTPVPQATIPAVMGRMTSIVPLAVAPIDGRLLSGPPM